MKKQLLSAVALSAATLLCARGLPPSPRIVADSDEIVRIEVVSCEDTVLRRGSPDTEDIKYGFEGGRIVKIGDTYYYGESKMASMKDVATRLLANENASEAEKKLAQDVLDKAELTME